MAKEQKLEQAMLGTDDRMGDNSEDQQSSLAVQQEGGGSGRTRQVQMLPEEGSGGGGDERDMKAFNSDLLTEVFSYLPQTELFEAMSVCKPWEEAVMEALVLLKEVEVHKKWDLRDRGAKRGDRAANQIIRTLLNSVRKVTFSGSPGMNLHIMSVAGVERPNLRALSLPKYSVDIAILSLFLSSCPRLESVKVDGELLDSDHIHMQHSTLRTFDIESRKSCPLTVHCPNLTHLSTVPYGQHDYGGKVAISLFCPRLTELCLSGNHSAMAVLDFMAAHAPNIKKLKFNCFSVDWFSSVTRFESLHCLKINGFGGKLPHAFYHWPPFYTLVLNNGRALYMTYRSLKSLRSRLNGLLTCAEMSITGGIGTSRDI